MANFYGIPFYIIFPVMIFLSFYLYVTRNFGYWKRLGIPEVTPMPFTGSLKFDFYSHHGKREQKWYKKYGKIFGIYEGAAPVLVIADPHLLKNILIKDFHVFSEGRGLRFGDNIIDRMLVFQHGKQWKELRSIMTPTFSSGKIKMMSKLIDDCGKILIDNFIEAAESKKEIDVTKYFGAYAMDVIARCSFGIQLDSRKDPNNPFLKAVRQTIKPMSWRTLIAVLFPGLAKLLRLSLFNPRTSLFFKDVAMQIINERKNLKEDQKPKDFLQLLLEAEKEDSDSKNGKKRLELDDVVSQCVMFFMVGYFTTAATLSFLAHQLAIKPKIQEKLIKEIDEVLKGKVNILI
ncbi:cytochrome P450 3A21-like [Centruroides vittatus]|uniref:cytochrome P450 3A21-like n=1 Tax=Centruroides vittatus TaxID=120091 RepID=UPI00350F1690